MVQEKVKNPLMAFTPDGDMFAGLTSSSTFKIWSTKNGNLLAEWKPVNRESGETKFISMACGFVGKKRRKEPGTCLLALGSDDGNVFTVDAFSGETKWRTTDSFPCEVSGLLFTNKGRTLCVVGNNGMVHKMNSETGDVLESFKASKKNIAALAFSCDENFIVLSDGRVRVLSLETCKEVLKFTTDQGHVQRASMSDHAETLVTSGHGESDLQVWYLDTKESLCNRGPIISMKHSPLSFQCKDGNDEDSGMAVLAISKSGAYVWHLRSRLEEEEVHPTKISCKVNGSVERSRVSIIAAQLLDLNKDGKIRALVTYGSIDRPQFTLVDVSNPGDDVVLNVSEETKAISENGVTEKGLIVSELEAPLSSKKSKKENKKRAASDLDQATPGEMVDPGNEEAVDGVVDEDLNEQTMGEKLADLNIVSSDIIVKSNENDETSLDAKPPSADSVHVLLKQALHADDRVLLLDCLYNQDEKVIANSVSQLNPSHVLKLLQSLMSITQSRGAILACALPWLKSLLLQHSSGIMSQKSSLVALNSLYQLIESRVSTFQTAFQLSSVLDILFTGIVDDDGDESGVIEPAIFEDKDSSEEESEDEAMETDDDNDGGDAEDEALGGISDLEGSDGMSD